jgi:hypothetical protein
MSCARSPSSSCTLDTSQWQEAPSQWREAPSHSTHSTEAADAPVESRFPRMLVDTLAGAPDELPHWKVDEFYDATGIVLCALSITTASWLREPNPVKVVTCPLRLRTNYSYSRRSPLFLLVLIDYWYGCWLRGTWVSSYKWLLMCKHICVAWGLDVTINWCRFLDTI